MVHVRVLHMFSTNPTKLKISHGIIVVMIRPAAVRARAEISQTQVRSGTVVIDDAGAWDRDHGHVGCRLLLETRSSRQSWGYSSRV